MDEKKIVMTEQSVKSGKKVLIIHYDDGTKKEVVKDLF